MGLYIHEFETKVEALKRGCRYAAICTANNEVLSFHKYEDTAEKAARRRGPGFWGVYDFKFRTITPATVYQKMSWER